MSDFDWLSELLARFEDEHILVRHEEARRLFPAHLLEIDVDDWGKAGSECAKSGCRWAGMWGDQQKDDIVVNACLEYEGDYLILRARVPLDAPVLNCHTTSFAGANRLERHAQDMLGLAFSDHPDERRWTRHQAWAEDKYPLRESFSADGGETDETPPDGEYPFNRVLGSGVYEIPVGPVHAGIIEPGHFRFSAVGERVITLEQHFGYVHKGIEKIAVGRDIAGLARLAARVSGDSTVAHAWAACQAVERALALNLPERADFLRGLLCERERVANHLGDIGAICNDVGFAFALYQFHRLREIWSRRSDGLFGHRFMMDVIVPGGVTTDIDADAAVALKQDHNALRAELAKLFDIITDDPSLEDRLLTTGLLTAETARSFGVTGYVGKASGQGFDLRCDNPHVPYDRVPVKRVVREEGDVMARMQVRMDEILASLDVMDKLLDDLPVGGVYSEPDSSKGEAEGIGFVEGFRGEIMTYVRLDSDGKVARFFPRDPSWFTWPALEKIQIGNIVPDFPVCNKSVNGSYSGGDL